MPTKSVGLIWLKLRFSTAANRVASVTLAGKLPASVVMVIVLASSDWMVPRTSVVFIADGGASAANASEDDNINRTARDETRIGKLPNIIATIMSPKASGNTDIVSIRIGNMRTSSFAAQIYGCIASCVNARKTL